MFKQQSTQEVPPGPRWQPNAAQVLIFVLVVVCGLVVFNAYQQAHEPPPNIAKIMIIGYTPRQLRYAKQVELWRQKLTENDMKLIWPYLGQYNVARIDLPSKTPVTLMDWDSASEAQAAREAYEGFVKARTAAKLPPTQPPDICIVHLFDVDGNEVAQASGAGIATT